MTRIEELWEGYASETLTPEGVREFLELVAEGGEPVTSLLDELLAGDAYRGLAADGKEEELIQRILARTRNTTASPRPATVRRLFPGWIRMTAAAAILLILVTGGYFIFFNKAPKLAQTGIQLHDVAPGGNRATLTLGNGTKIILDSAANGRLSLQGNADVIKTGSGQLAYRPAVGSAADVVYNTLTTPRGGQYQLALPDGTKVWLNAASSIRYPTAFSGNGRRVEITGEAYFEVQADKSKPFFVNIPGRGAVDVLGTHFNINAYDDEPTVNTTLLEGSVRVSSGGQTSRGGAQGAGNSGSVVLKPGQQAQLGNGQTRIAPDANIAEVMAWKNGYFAFNGATTEAIMRQVARWYDAEVVWEGNVKNERFAGTVPRSANASKLLEVLGLTKTVQFTIENKKIIVKPYHP